MQGTITDDQAHLWLTDIVQGDPIISNGRVTGYYGSWISLHYDTPALNSDDRAEISGGGYQRIRMAFSDPSNRGIWSTKDARFSGLQSTKLVYYGIWNRSNNGILRAYGELPEPVLVTAGGGYVLPQGHIGVSFG